MKRLIETAKTVLLVLLFCATLLVAYLSSSSYGINKKTDKDDISFAGNTDYSSSLDGGYLLPDFIGAKISGNAGMGFFSDYDRMRELYSSLSPYLTALFGASSEICGEPDFLTAADSDEFIYLRYHSELPIQIIRAHAASGDAQYASFSSAEAQYAKELVIVLSSESNGLYSYEGYTLDSSDVYRHFYFTDDSELLDADSFLNSTDISSASDFSFIYSGNFNTNKSVSQTQPILAASPEVRQYYFDKFDSAKSDSGEGAILSLLEINPDRVGGYTESDGAVVYVETHGTFRLRGNFAKYEAAIDGGLATESYLPYTRESSSLNIFDCILASENILSELSETSKNIIGNDAEILLSSVTSNATALTVNFAYFPDNVRLISSDAPYAASFTFTGNKLTACSFYLIGCENMTYRIHSFSQEWLLGYLGGKLTADDDKTAFMTLAYMPSAIPSEASAEWIIEH